MELILKIFLVLCLLGLVYFVFRAIFKLFDAILFGIFDTAIRLLNVTKDDLKNLSLIEWKEVVIWTISNPWEAMINRLFGSDSLTKIQEIGDWIYIPPFKLFRKSSKYKIKD